ncbi:MAG: hypothetical protein OM95_03570 [Bdellovibrio sp. ArHS]|nr:MAG: hypothetical protein OM95_03570 [Bdellovibrio sp. ArHS]
MAASYEGRRLFVFFTLNTKQDLGDAKNLSRPSNLPITLLVCKLSMKGRGNVCHTGNPNSKKEGREFLEFERDSDGRFQ